MFKQWHLIHKLALQVKWLLLTGLLWATTCLAAGPPPVITVQPLSQSVPLLGSVTFEVGATSGTRLTYEWRKDGKRINNANSSTYTINKVSASDAGTYVVRVTNSGGTVASSNAVLTVLMPPTIDAQPADVAVVPGQTANFTVQASGSGSLRYQWFFGTAPLPGETKNVLTILKARTSDAGTYSVTVSNEVGSVASKPASLTVNVPPVITKQPVSQTVVLGANATFSAAATGTSPLSYQWYFNDVSLGNAGATATFTVQKADPSEAGRYYVTVTSPWGSTTSSAAILTVSQPLLITSQPQNVTVSPGQTAIFSVKASGSPPLSYQWFSANLHLPDANTDTLTITNAQPEDAGTYFAVVSDGSTSVTSTVAVLSVDTGLTILAQPASQSVLQGEQTAFTFSVSGAEPLACQWFLNGAPLRGATNATLTFLSAQTTDAGIYYAVITNAFNSVTSAPVTLVVNVPPAVSSGPRSLAVIQGNTAVFKVEASGTPNLNYQWYFKGSAILGATEASLTIANAQPSDEGDYVVTVNNLWGTAISPSAQLTVYIPVVLLAQPSSLVIKQGQAATFSVSASGSVPISYQWYLNGLPIAGATQPSLNLPAAQPANEGTYTVQVSNPAGTVVSQPATLTVKRPAVVLTLSDNSGVTPKGFAFSLSPPPGTVYIVLGSTNMVDWTPIATNQAASASEIFVDPEALQLGSRLYRVVIP